MDWDCWHYLRSRSSIVIMLRPGDNLSLKKIFILTVSHRSSLNMRDPTPSQKCDLRVILSSAQVSRDIISLEKTPRWNPGDSLRLETPLKSTPVTLNTSTELTLNLPDDYLTLTLTIILIDPSVWCREWCVCPKVTQLQLAPNKLGRWRDNLITCWAVSVWGRENMSIVLQVSSSWLSSSGTFSFTQKVLRRRPRNLNMELCN